MHDEIVRKHYDDDEIEKLYLQYCLLCGMWKRKGSLIFMR